MNELEFRQWLGSKFHYFKFENGSCGGVVSATLDKFPVDQYIGKKDIENNKMFTGDIVYRVIQEVKIANRTIQERIVELGVIVYNSVDCAYYVFDDNLEQLHSFSSCPSFKIIGNKYEHNIDKLREVYNVLY